jgi:hypothetical protein
MEVKSYKQVRTFYSSFCEIKHRSNYLGCYDHVHGIMRVYCNIFLEFTHYEQCAGAIGANVAAQNDWQLPATGYTNLVICFVIPLHKPTCNKASHNLCAEAK